jgi:hypothetical protein
LEDDGEDASNGEEDEDEDSNEEAVPGAESNYTEHVGEFPWLNQAGPRCFSRGRVTPDRKGEPMRYAIWGCSFCGTEPKLHKFEPDAFRKHEHTVPHGNALRRRVADHDGDDLLLFYGIAQGMATSPLVNSSKAQTEADEYIRFMSNVCKERQDAAAPSNRKRKHAASDTGPQLPEFKTLQGIWASYGARMRRGFPEISILIMIALVLPMSNAIVERTFSKMNIIHTSMRNRLHVETVTALMLISIEGKSLPDFMGDEELLAAVMASWREMDDGDKHGSGRHARGV